VAGSYAGETAGATKGLNAALGDGYSHRIAATNVPVVYIGVWVAGPDGAQDIHYRVFQR